jgi:hypothetical protein
MSGHLIGCVKPIKDLPTRSHKLALLAFADSGDDRTHIALPGYEGVQEWVGCGRSQAFALIQDLITLGYLRQHKRGHRGQRAEWIVFPNGCCDTHRTPVAEEPVDVDQLAAAAGIDPEQARLLLTAMGHDAPPSKTAQKGSDQPGPNERGKGPVTPDPIGDDTPHAVDNPGDEAAKGTEWVRQPRVTADAFTPSENPLTPTGKPAGERSTGRCSRHPEGHANCRGCGTTARQRADAERRAAAELHRAEQRALAQQARLARDQAAPPPEDLRDRVAAAAAEQEP